MSKIGMIRAAAVSPELKIANTAYNTDEILACIDEAEKKGAGLILFPELCITGYSCGDLFYQELLYQRNLDGLKKIIDHTKKQHALVVVGFYFRLSGSFYNCAAIIQNGQLKGIVPKMFLPHVQEFSESRWFASGAQLSPQTRVISLFEQQVPFGWLIFHDEENDLNLGVEICQDLYVPLTPGTQLALNGAHILLNLSASTEMVGKAEARKNWISHTSAANICGYVYASAGVHESTTDMVFGGHRMIAECGICLKEGDRFVRESAITYADIDYEKIRFERAFDQHFDVCKSMLADQAKEFTVNLDPLTVLKTKQNVLERHYMENPFVPADPLQLTSNCEEVFHIQASGLAKRMEHTHANKAVIGISGGLDSTLALLVCVEAFRQIGRDRKDILAVTMPGFGTTGKTYNNALAMMKLLGVEVREISIKASVLQHFQDIGHDPQIHNVTYENAQARERTQILMDIANMTGGLVVGTGDLSEVALGWSTYNGDHMSMYAVNAGVPKTLIRWVIDWVMHHRLSGSQEDRDFSSDNVLLTATLQDVMDTPISPELLPPDDAGNIAQKTEDTVGPYILHDFFLYHTIRSGMRPKKLLFIARSVFAREYSEELIKKWLEVFYRRFFSQQFKRSCMPDGPKIGSVGFSPRGDWKMPSDADAKLWLDELN